MNGWDQVRWTEARQIAELMGDDEDRWPAAGTVPRARFAALRADGDRVGAIQYLGHALPRFEALAWAGRVLDIEGRTRMLRPRDRHALDVSLRWLGDPNDDRRRAAQDAADEAGEESPERLLAMAVFLSGGSISQPDLQPVPPPPEAAGRMAASAVIVAAFRGDQAVAVLDRALDLGDSIAAHGMRALTEA